MSPVATTGNDGRDRRHYGVNTLNHSRNLQPLPDFLGIGAQRSGTTWLYQNLRRHPQIWMPPKKELHYFDRSVSYPSPSFLAEDALMSRVFGRGKPSRQWRQQLKASIRRCLRHPSRADVAWHLNFFFGSYSDEWYASLFKQAGERVKGEITPSYSILNPEDIEHVADMMPEAKLLLMLRNPIDRAWSAIKYGSRKTGQDPSRLSPGQFGRIAAREEVSRRGDYVTIIENWHRFFPADQFLIGFFEDIAYNPSAFLTRIFEFLGVDSSEERVTQLAFRKMNPSPKKSMPAEFRLVLTKSYYPQIRKLSEIVGGNAHEWRREAEELLETGLA